MKARYLFGLGMVAAIISILGLRANAVRSVELKNTVIQKDQAGADVSTELESLRGFVFSHMNSSVRFELPGAHRRALSAAQAQAQGGATGEVYAAAQAACGPEVGTNSVAQVACVQRYLDSHLGSTSTPAPDLPQPAEFSYAFAAPSWSPDLAGLAMLVAAALIGGALLNYIRGLFKARRQAGL